MVTGDILQIKASCSARIKKSNATPSLQAQLISQLLLSTMKYSFMLHNILLSAKPNKNHQNKACLWER